MLKIPHDVVDASAEGGNVFRIDAREHGNA
jgi:hypothetical protein